MGCPNRLSASRADIGLRAWLLDETVHLTPAARQVLGGRPTGGTGPTIGTLVESGQLALLEARLAHPIAGSGTGAGREPQPVEPPLTTTSVGVDEVTAWIKIQVVDDRTSEPIPGVPLEIKLPDGKEVGQATRADGMVHIQQIDPGTCDVRCELNLNRARRTNTAQFMAMGKAPVEAVAEPERWRGAQPPAGASIAHIEEHKVTNGETIKSLAEANGMTWQQLAKFNWGTSVPRKINEALRAKVGCWKKTRDGHNYVFTEQDDPGIVYIPREWREEGLPTEQTHVIRVKLLRPFVVVLENMDELRIPETEFDVTLADGTRQRRKLGRQGMTLIKDPPPGEIVVRYLDPDDVTAKSLAVSARKSFDDRDTHPIFKLLKREAEIVNLSVSVYDTYFNDLHGEGLINDIYAEFTDPVALEAAEGLMALAGIEPRRDMTPMEWDEERDLNV